MGTIFISSSSFGTLPVSAPTTFTSTSQTWPGGQGVNGTKSYTVSDADMADIIAWSLQAFPQGSTAPTSLQALLSWINGSIVVGTKQAVQQLRQQSLVAAAGTSTAPVFT